MQKLILFLHILFLSLWCSGLLNAQKWKGQVFNTNERGETSATAAIIINQTQGKQTFSESNGRFKLKAKTGDSIRIQLLEDSNLNWVYKFKVTPGSPKPQRDTGFVWRGQVSFSFPFSSVQSEDLVVVSYAKSETDKGSRILAQAFNIGNYYNPYQLIQGKIPGAVITRPGGDPNYDYQVQIRGLHSAIYPGFANFPTTTGYNKQFNLTQPLVVVDGMPGWSLNSIDPQDIAGIEVLKDAASLAVYGMRGANGVIKIHSKYGAANSRGIEYSTYLAIDRASKPDRGIDAATYRSLINGEFRGVNQDLGADNDWYKLISRTGFSHAHNLAIHGAAARSNYRLALNFREVNGIIPKSGFEQLNALLTFQKRIQKRKGSLLGLFAINQRNSTEVNPEIFRNAAIMNPTAPIFKDIGSLLGSYYQPYSYGILNPLAMLYQQNYENSLQNFTAGLNGRFALFAGINAVVNSGLQYSQDNYGQASSDHSFGFVGSSVYSSWEKRRLVHWYLNAQLAKTWYFKNHSLSIQMGYSTQTWDGRGVLREGKTTSQNRISYHPLINVQGNPAFLTRNDSYRESDAMPAQFTQAQYYFKGRWFAQGSLRREGFTRLGNAKWVTYPSLMIGGVLIEGRKFLDELRVSLSYGVTGNIPPKNHATSLIVLPLNSISTNSNIYVNGEFKPGIYYPHVPNPNITAEQRRELNLGFAAELMNQRLQIYFDLYQSHSSKLLWQYNSDYPGVFSNVHFENRMELSNQGVEIQLNLAAINQHNWQWQSNLSLAHNRTKVESPFPTNAPGITSDIYYVGRPGNPGLCCDPIQVLENQKPIGVFYAFHDEGIDANGQWKIRDLDGDGQTPSFYDRTKMGNAQPNLTFGWDNNLKWKRVTVNVFWRGALGHRMVNFFNGVYANPQNLKEWQNHSIPEVALNSEFSKLRAPWSYLSNYFVRNASFFRLDNLSIAYDFVKKPQKEQNLQLYISAQNLVTLSSFIANDPEVRLSRIGAPLLPGIVNVNNYFSGVDEDLNNFDRGRYPLTKTLVIGAKLKL